MTPTSKPASTHQDLSSLKRKVILTVLTACVTAGWLNLALTRQLEAASVVSLISITVPLIVLARWPHTLRFIEVFMTLLIAALFVLMIVTALILKPDLAMTVNFAVLAPAVHLLAFLMLGVRLGLRVSLGFLLCVAATIATGFIPAAGVTLLPGATTILASFFVVSVVSVACLCAFAYYLERQSQARTQAEAVAQYAYVDTLTGLPNRLLFNDRLDHALKRATRSTERFALLFIDLDHFKHVNDTHGHQAGDDLLQQLARRLQNAVRTSDTAARISGDEFAIIAYDTENAERIAEHVMQALRAPFNIAGQPYFATCSIGVSVFPQHGTTAEQLLACADHAMYRSKADGRNTYHVFSTHDAGGHLDRRTIERELRTALSRNALQLHYQPIYDVSNGTLVGMEALARWQHPEHGNIPPNDFIPVAEETRLILPLGNWVLQEACRQNRHWQRHGHAPIAVAVNVSAIQFEQPEFVDVVKQALSDSGLAPEWLELELTESAVLIDAAVPRLAELQALGVRVSLDDFGTGYSSLARLQRLPIAGFKIDRSFINDLTNRDPVTGSRRVIKIIMMLAEALELRVVAEGIETSEQLDEVRRTGCGRAQGFWLSKPLPPEAAESLLEQFRTAATRPGT